MAKKKKESLTPLESLIENLLEEGSSPAKVAAEVKKLIDDKIDGLRVWGMGSISSDQAKAAASQLQGDRDWMANL